MRTLTAVGLTAVAVGGLAYWYTRQQGAALGAAIAGATTPGGPAGACLVPEGTVLRQPADLRRAAATAAGQRALMITAQAQLCALGYPITRIDGQGGPETTAAAAAFASDRGISVNSVADEIALARAIDTAYAAPVSAPA